MRECSIGVVLDTNSFHGRTCIIISRRSKEMRHFNPGHSSGNSIRQYILSWHTIKSHNMTYDPHLYNYPLVRIFIMKWRCEIVQENLYCVPQWVNSYITWSIITFEAEYTVNKGIGTTEPNDDMLTTIPCPL